MKITLHNKNSETNRIKKWTRCDKWRGEHHSQRQAQAFDNVHFATICESMHLISIRRVSWGWISSFTLYSISNSIIYWGRCKDGVAARCLKVMLDKMGGKSLDRRLGGCWTSSRLISNTPGQLCSQIIMECRHTYLASMLEVFIKNMIFKSFSFSENETFFHWRVLFTNIARIIA